MCNSHMVVRKGLAANVTREPKFEGKGGERERQRERERDRERERESAVRSLWGRRQCL